MTDADGVTLVRLAREAIEERLLGARSAEGDARETKTSGLEARRGVFVTLTVPGPGGARALRGCIGSTRGTEPLHEGVRRAARAAAFDDPRFAPLAREELHGLAIKVTVLTEPLAVDSPEAIVPGEHGVVLASGGRSAVFLPEVAAEHRWTREELLVQLCRKARLPDTAWRSARLSVFTGRTFGEC